MDPLYLPSFVDGTEELFTRMLNLPLKWDERDGTEPASFPCDVTAIIGLSGDSAGTFTLSFDKETALKLVSRFVGCETDSLIPDGADGVCELANIIVGRAIALLRSGGIVLHMSLPQAVIGVEHRFQCPDGAWRKSIEFECELGRFKAEIFVKHLPQGGPTE